MIKSITSFILICLAVQMSAQQSMTIEEVKNKYGQFIEAFKNTAFDDRVYIDKKVVVPENDTLLAEFVSTNQSFIELLMANYNTVTSDEFKRVKDAEKIQEKYIEKLQADELFNQYFLPYISYFYKSKGYEVEGTTGSKKVYTFDEMMDVAVKYFEVTSIDSRGNYKTRLAIGEAGLVKTLEKRHPLLEIFCVHTIKQNLYQADKVLTKSRKIVEKLQLGINESDRLKRAEGVIYGFVSQDEAFRKVLQKAYEKQAATLPFIIQE